MIQKCLLYIAIAFLIGCKTVPDTSSRTTNIEIGKSFIDAFYSFDKAALQELLASAARSQSEILYYQKWAKCANYKIVDRTHFFERSDSVVVFPITVKDDLMGALEIDFNVTDTFHIVVREGEIRSVKTSSNDLPVYYETKEWVNKNRPDYVAKACEGIWAGGPTPCECVQGMVKGFTDFTKRKKDANLSYQTPGDGNP
jgi:hypothetical protein